MCESCVVSEIGLRTCVEWLFSYHCSLFTVHC